MSGSAAFEVIPVEGIGEVGEGDRVGELIVSATALEAGDVVVVAQKVVSKAEGQLRKLGGITPGPEAARIAEQTGRDPRLVELILAESQAVLRATPQALIVRTRHGFVCANAGIDASNLAGEESVLLLPADPDASAREIRSQINEASGCLVGVVVADSFGRAWRIGQVDVAIGAAGISVTDDWRGRTDSQGRELLSTEVAVADQLASAADLARTKDAGIPAVVIRGLAQFLTEEDGPGAKALRRAEEKDLFL